MMAMRTTTGSRAIKILIDTWVRYFILTVTEFLIFIVQMLVNVNAG